MKSLIFILILSGIFSCATSNKKIDINQDSITPGTSVKVKGKEFKLYKGSLKLGDNFIKKIEGTGIDFKFQNKTTIINIVPSIDTPVCEEQTHLLGESKSINSGIDLINISRDLPMAQDRFAKEAKLENIRFYSDYKYGQFGKNTGLLIKDKEILTRGVLVLDSKGSVKYLQFVSELTELPDMDKAIQFANSLK